MYTKCICMQVDMSVPRIRLGARNLGIRLLPHACMGAAVGSAQLSFSLVSLRMLHTTTLLKLR